MLHASLYQLGLNCSRAFILNLQICKLRVSGRRHLGLDTVLILQLQEQEWLANRAVLLGQEPSMDCDKQKSDNTLPRISLPACRRRQRDRTIARERNVELPHYSPEAT